MSEQLACRLTDEELDALDSVCRSRKRDRQVAAAQAKKLVEGGNERCDNAAHWPSGRTGYYGPPIRFECAECQVELCKDVGLFEIEVPKP